MAWRKAMLRCVPAQCPEMGKAASPLDRVSALSSRFSSALFCPLYITTTTLVPRPLEKLIKPQGACYRSSLQMGWGEDHVSGNPFGDCHLGDCWRGSLRFA